MISNLRNLQFSNFGNFTPQHAGAAGQKNCLFRT